MSKQHFEHFRASLGSLEAIRGHTEDGDLMGGVLSECTEVSRNGGDTWDHCLKCMGSHRVCMRRG